MKTKFDCLYSLFELKEASLGTLAKKVGSSPSSVRQRLSGFLKDNLVINKDGKYLPNKDNEATWAIFDIMKSSRARGINYNFFLKPQFAELLKSGYKKDCVRIEDFKSQNYATVRKYLTFLSRINLILVISKKPLRVRFISDPIFDRVLSLYGKRLPKPQTQKKSQNFAHYRAIEGLLLQYRRQKNRLDLASLEEEQKIEFTSASTQLEGNTFTLEQSKELILNDIVPHDKKLKEASEVKNYYLAVNHLIANLHVPISIDYIVDLHRFVIFNSGVSEGIRSSRVSIGGNPFYEVSHHSGILPKLDALCRRINEFLKKKRSVRETIEFATFVHNEFQHIHPFDDGNSRTTRLIWNYVLMNQGFPIISIYSNAREEYLSLTKLAKQRDDAKLNNFLLQVIKDNLFKLTRV